MALQRNLLLLHVQSDQRWTFYLYRWWDTEESIHAKIRFRYREINVSSRLSPRLVQLGTKCTHLARSYKYIMVITGRAHWFLIFYILTYNMFIDIYVHTICISCDKAVIWPMFKNSSTKLRSDEDLEGIRLLKRMLEFELFFVSCCFFDRESLSLTSCKLHYT